MPWHVQLGRVRRRIWLVALVTVLALAGGGGSILMTPVVYSKQAALTATSQTRSPDQDAILAQGYVNFFNDPGYQATLRKRAGVAGDVTFEAQTAAGSPLIYVVASSTSESDVESAASKMATALLDTVNGSLNAARDNTIAKVRKPYDDARGSNGTIPDAAQEQLEYQISLLNANTTNQLTELELQSGVTSNAPNIAKIMGLSLVAGLALGVSIALAAGGLTRRVESAVELTAKTGIPVLAEIPRCRAEIRSARYGQLLHAISGVDESPAVVAVTSAKSLRATARVARAIAEHRVAEGQRVVVLDADLRPASSTVGLSDYLNEPDEVDLGALVPPGGTHAVGMIEIGRGQQCSEVETMDRERFERLLSMLRDRADLTVIITSPIIESANTQMICTLADTTLLVAEQSRTRTADLEQARRLIDQVKGEVAGVALVGRRAIKPARDSASESDRGVSQPSTDGDTTAARSGDRTNARRGTLVTALQDQRGVPETSQSARSHDVADVASRG